MRVQCVDWTDQEQRLIQKATRSQGFLRELETDPKSAICRALAIELPEDLKVHVLKSAFCRRVVIQLFQMDDRNLYLMLSPPVTESLAF